MTKRNIRHFLISICITTSLMLLKRWNILEEVKDSISPRSLFEETIKKYVCDQAGSRLTNKYKKGFREKEAKQKGLSKAQKSIIDFARDSSYKNIKPYLKRVGIFIFFLVLDIIFIILWISYCSCCCCCCCLFKTSKPSKFCSCLFFSIAALCNFLVLIFSIIALALTSPFFKRINGFGCSSFNFLDHVRYGLAPSYVNNQNEWEGISGFIDKLKYNEEQKKDIEDTMKMINITQDYKGGKCSKEFEELESIVNYTNKLIKESFDEIDFDVQAKDLEDAQKTFDDADEEIGDDVYDALHNYINKHAKRVCKLVFSLTLIFSFLGLLFLGFYFFSENSISRIIYIFIWNISMLLMIFAVLLSSVFGIISYIFKDTVQVGQYILSPENLKSEDPLLLESSDEYVSDLIDVCANGDGNFMEIIQENGQLKENIKNWENNRTYYQNKINNIDNFQCEENEKIELKENYRLLLDVTSKGLNISNNLTNVNCRFARNDKNIILNEVNSAGKLGIALSSCSFIVGILLGISVLAGIIVVHKYKFDSSYDDNKHLKELSTTSAGNQSTQSVPKIMNTSNTDNTKTY